MKTMLRAIVLLSLALSITAIFAGNDTAPTIEERTLAHATDMRATSYGIIQPTMLVDGLLIGNHTALLPGDDIETGVYWAPVGFVYESDCGPVSISGNTVIGVVEGTGGVSVTCVGSFYACCFCTQSNGHQCPVARCRQSGTPEPNGGCQGGGPGAVSCSISMDACP